MMEQLMKAYVAKEVLERATRDAGKYLRKRAKHIDWDGGLHKVGLTTYRPGRATMGGVSFFLFGAAIGGLAALLLAPKRGAELRQDMKQYLNRDEGMPTTTGVGRIDTSPNARV